MVNALRCGITASPTPALVIALILTISTVRGDAHPLEITVTAPSDDGFAVGSSWISLLGTALLAEGAPAYFWGAVPADAVQSACSIIEQGTNSIPATVTAYGYTMSWNLQVIRSAILVSES